jgi:cell division protein FtsW
MKNKFRITVFEKSEGRIDYLFLLSVLALSVFGTLMVYSAGYAYADFRYNDAYYFVKRQTVWLIAGFIIMVLSSRINTELYKRLSTLFYIATVFLLLLVLLIGFVGNGAKRWISIGPLTIQPSEIAKLTMVMMLSYYFSKKETIACAAKTKKQSFIFGTLIPFLIMLLPIILVMLQKHLSCIIILGLIGIIVIVLSGVNLGYLYGFGGLGVLGVSYIAFFTDYTKERITVWRNPEAYKLTGGWQTLQGLMAIGSGGVFGKGLFRSELKYCYVSEPANDMIFAILCEELGLIGAILTLFLFGILIFRGFKIANGTDNTYERLLTLGIVTKIAIQALLNVAVVTNTIPNTGISLPFFSYGGSSLIMLFFEMGIILSISKKARIKGR